MAKDRDDDKKKLITGKDMSSLSAAINDKFKGNISQVANTIDATISTKFIYSTGIMSLDKYCGTGGLIGGRIINVWGHEGTGKTLSSLCMAASVQQQKVDPYPGNPEGIGRVAFLDAEGTFAPNMATALGVDTSRLILFKSTPERILVGEDYFDLMKILIQNGVELIIVDSVPAMVPSCRMDATIGQGQKSTHAIMMAEGLQQLTPLLGAFGRSVVWMINQVRAKPMVMFGPTEGHTGGEALKFFETYSLEVRKKGDIVKKVQAPNDGWAEKRIGVTVECKMIKNKTATIPCLPIQFDIYFDTTTDKEGNKYVAGVDVFKDLSEVGIASGVIKQSSSWFSYGDIKGNGRDQFYEELRKVDPMLLLKIRSEILTAR